MLSVGYVGRRSEAVRVKEGREHPESGLPFKATTTEAGTVIEHGAAGSAVSSRQDAIVTPQMVVVKSAAQEG